MTVLWPRWIVGLLNGLPTSTALQDKLIASEARNLVLSDENAGLRDDIRERDKTIKKLEWRIDQLSPDSVDTVEHFLLGAMARYGDDHIYAETIAERCGASRHEIRLRLAHLVDNNYVGRSDQGRYYLTLKALRYLQTKGEFNELDDQASPHESVIEP